MGLLKKLITWLLIGFIISGGVYIFWHTIKGYFVFSVNDGLLYDGLGREVYEAPWWYSLVLRETSWPGWKYTLIDSVTFWIYLAISAGLVEVIKFINKDYDNSKSGGSSI